MQAQTYQMDPNKVITSITPIYINGFSQASGLHSVDNNLIYSAGNNIIVDPLDQNKTKYSLKGHDNVISAICVSSNLLVASGQLGSPGNKNYDSPVFVWKLTMANPICRFDGLKEGVRSLCFSENNQFLAGVSNKGQLVIWDTKQGKQIFAKIFQFPVNLLYFNNESLIITLGKGIQEVDIVPLLNENKHPLFNNFTLPSTGLPRTFTSLIKISPHQYLVSNQSGEVCMFVKRIFKWATVIGKGKVHAMGILSNKIDLFAAVGTQIVRFELINDNLKEKYRQDYYNGRKMCISGKDQIFLIDKGGLLKVSTNLQTKVLRNSHSSRINGLAIRQGLIASVDQARIMSWTFKNGSVSFLGLHNSKQLQTTCVEVGEDRTIFVGNNNGKIDNWSCDLTKTNWQISGHKGAVTVIFSGENYFLSGGEDSVVRIWASGSRQLINQISVHQKPISGVLGDCKFPFIIHSCSLDRSLHTYDMKSDKKFNFRQLPKGTITSMDQSKTNNNILTCGPATGVCFWKENDMLPCLTIESGHLKLMKACFNSSGSIVAIGAQNGDIYLFNARSNQYIGVIVMHSRQITGLSWIDDKNLVSVSEDQIIAVWPIGNL